MRPNNRKLLWISVVISTYFLALYLIWFYKVETTIIGVFQELLTIPMAVGLMVLLFFTGKKLVKQQGRTTANISAFILSLITFILIFQSL